MFQTTIQPPQVQQNIFKLVLLLLLVVKRYQHLLQRNFITNSLALPVTSPTHPQAVKAQALIAT